MNTPLAASWLADPAWLGMEPTARGFHAQLLLLAAQQKKHPGCLPDKDLQWRKWLGLPLKTPESDTPALPKQWAKAFSTTPFPDALVHLTQAQVEGEEPDIFAMEQVLSWLWEHRWKPSILASWQKIDATLIEQHPEWAELEGYWFHPLALRMSAPDKVFEVIAEVKPKGAKSAKKTARSSSKRVVVAIEHWNDQIDISGEAANEGLIQLDGDYEGWRDPDIVMSKWFTAIDQETRKSLWEVGVTCLVGPNPLPKDERNARSVLGKHIKKYGEEKVAKAISSLSVRSIPPADAVAFLQGVLRAEEEGSVAEQTARSRRATVAL